MGNHLPLLFVRDFQPPHVGRGNVDGEIFCINPYSYRDDCTYLPATGRLLLSLPMESRWFKAM